MIPNVMITACEILIRLVIHQKENEDWSQKMQITLLVLLYSKICILCKGVHDLNQLLNKNEYELQEHCLQYTKHVQCYLLRTNYVFFLVNCVLFYGWMPILPLILF